MVRGISSVQGSTFNTCSICLEDVHITERERRVVPCCGHQLHYLCAQNLINSGHRLCPSCRGPLYGSHILQGREIVNETLPLPSPNRELYERIFVAVIMSLSVLSLLACILPPISSYVWASLFVIGVYRFAREDNFQSNTLENA